MSKIDELKEKYKDNLVADGVHAIAIRAVYIDTLFVILEELRCYVELAEMVSTCSINVDSFGNKYAVLKLEGILIELIEQIRADVK